jgi:hypothetical protein
MMSKYTRYEYDNPDSGHMYEYMEARIEALKRHILHLEAENKALRRWKQPEGAHSDSRVSLSA